MDFPPCHTISVFKRLSSGVEHAYEFRALYGINDYFRTYDPRHLREKEIFTKLGYIDIQHFASRIQAKVRMYTGLMDTVAPPSTQFATYNKIVAPKDYQLYPDFGHEYLPGQQEDVMQFMQEMVK